MHVMYIYMYMLICLVFKIYYENDLLDRLDLHLVFLAQEQLRTQ